MMEKKFRLKKELPGICGQVESIPAEEEGYYIFEHPASTGTLKISEKEIHIYTEYFEEVFEPEYTKRDVMDAMLWVLDNKGWFARNEDWEVFDIWLKSRTNAKA
jgi:hypothetical protein